MARPIAAITTIPCLTENVSSLDHAIHSCARRLLDIRTEPVVGEPNKSDAQRRVRDLLDLSRIIDEMFLAFGREVRSEFGSKVDLSDFTDVTRRELEGNATHTICAAMEARLEDLGEDAACMRRDFLNGPVSDDRWRDFPPAA